MHDPMKARPAEFTVIVMGNVLLCHESHAKAMLPHVAGLALDIESRTCIECFRARCRHEFIVPTDTSCDLIY